MRPKISKTDLTETGGEIRRVLRQTVIGTAASSSAARLFPRKRGDREEIRRPVISDERQPAGVERAIHVGISTEDHARHPHVHRHGQRRPIGMTIATRKSPTNTRRYVRHLRRHTRFQRGGARPVSTSSRTKISEELRVSANPSAKASSSEGKAPTRRRREGPRLIRVGTRQSRKTKNPPRRRPPSRGTKKRAVLIGKGGPSGAT